MAAAKDGRAPFFENTPWRFVAEFEQFVQQRHPRDSGRLRAINTMKEIKEHHKSHGDPKGGPINQGHPPYWRCAHRDWRLWFCVILMLAAMLVYLATGDLRWPFHGHSQAMVPAAVGQ